MRENTLPVKVHAVVRETPEAVTLVLAPLAQELRLDPYQPGQFLTLLLNVDGQPLRRSYSLATTPYTDALPAITVKRVAGGRASTYLTEQLKAGDYLEVIGPAGTFTLDFSAQQQRKVVFVGAGSGITPLYSLLQGLLHCEPDSSALLLYASRDSAHIIYRQALEQLQSQHPQRFALMHLLSQAQPSWAGLRGRLTETLASRLLPSDADSYLLCGPQGFMELARRALYAQGVDPARVRQESFVTAAAPQPKLRTKPAQLTLRDEGIQQYCQVAPEETLLEAALRCGIDIPYTCGSGICNTCRARCVAGQVVMSQDEGLSEQERKEGYVLTCVAHAASDEVVLAVE